MRRFYTATMLLLCVFASSAGHASETTTHTYDALGRLIKVDKAKSGDGGTQVDYSYDATGNRTNVTMKAVTSLRDKLAPYMSASAATKGPITIVTFGNSHGTGQGTSFANQPGEQLKAVLQNAFPGVSVVHHNYAVPGSWQAQMWEQIDRMNREGVKADIALILDPANDGMSSIYHALQSPIDYRRILGENIRRLQDAGAVVLSHTTPLPHPKRSLISGRFDFSPDFFLAYPTVSWVSFDNFQTFTYNAAKQTITSNVQAQFTFFSPGWVAKGRWMRLNENGAFYRITDVDSTGTTITVDDGNGGRAFTSDRVTGNGMRVGRIDSKYQITPARNENDLSRPVGLAVSVPLALQPQNLSGNGVTVFASIRHLELNVIDREVTTQNRAVLVDWGSEFQKLLTSDAAYDTLYPNNDDFHPGDQGYRLLTPIYQRLVQAAIK